MIHLLEPSEEENGAEEQCVQLTFWAIGEILDGVFFKKKYRCENYYDTVKKMYVAC